jgi:hypothetical protein
MSQVLEVADQEGLAQLEKEFANQYKVASEAETAMLRAGVTASVKAHRLGTLALRLRPLVEEREGKGKWGSYLQRNDMAARTVERAELIATYLDEKTASTMTLRAVEDKAAELRAIARGNVASADEWRALNANLAKIRAKLDAEESQTEKDLAALKEKLEKDAQDEYDARAKELDAARLKAQKRVMDEANAHAEETAEKLNGKEMAAALAVEQGKASIPLPRVGMPSAVAAELDLSNKGRGIMEQPEEEETEEDEDEEEADLLDTQQIHMLTERLTKTVATRRRDLSKACADQNVQAALETFLEECGGDPELAYGVLSDWIVRNLD